MKFGFIVKHRAIWPIGVQCGALGVSRSGYYAWRRRAPSRRAVTDAAIVQTLRTAFALSDSTYGVRASGTTCATRDVCVAANASGA